MYKLAKWAFNLGVISERRRIRERIAEYRLQHSYLPMPPNPDTKRAAEEQRFQQRVHEEVSRVLDDLTGLYQTQMVHKSFLDVDEKL